MKLDAERLAGVSERNMEENANDVIVGLGARNLGWGFFTCVIYPFLA